MNSQIVDLSMIDISFVDVLDRTVNLVVKDTKKKRPKKGAIVLPINENA
jgi:hypothetical protein